MAIKRKLNTKKYIADEIEYKIGKCVFAIFTIVALVFMVLLTSQILSAKEKELTLQSEAASWELSDFF